MPSVQSLKLQGILQSQAVRVRPEGQNLSQKKDQIQPENGFRYCQRVEAVSNELWCLHFVVYRSESGLKIISICPGDKFSL